jgi:hypothetical protein
MVTDKDLSIIRKILQHKPIVSHGMTFSFSNVNLELDRLSLNVNVQISDERSWAYPQLVTFANNIIHQILKMASYTLRDVYVKTIVMSVNGEEIDAHHIHLSPKDGKELSEILSDFPKTINLGVKDYTITLETRYNNKYDIETDYDQIYLNVGYDIDRIILSNDINDKKIVISSLEQNVVNSIADWLLVGELFTIDDIRTQLESFLYSGFMSDVFNINELSDTFLQCYIIPSKICGKKVNIREYADVNPEVYFKDLILKSLD